MPAEKTSMFLPPPLPPPPCFPLCLACLVQSLPPVKDTPCCPGSFLSLLTGQRNVKLFLAEIIFREVSKPRGRHQAGAGRHTAGPGTLGCWRQNCPTGSAVSNVCTLKMQRDTADKVILMEMVAERSSPVLLSTLAICCHCSFSSWIRVVSPAGSISGVSGCAFHFIPRYQLKFTAFWGLQGAHILLFSLETAATRSKTNSSFNMQVPAALKLGNMK